MYELCSIDALLLPVECADDENPVDGDALEARMSEGRAPRGKSMNMRSWVML